MPDATRLRCLLPGAVLATPTAPPVATIPSPQTPDEAAYVGCYRINLLASLAVTRVRDTLRIGAGRRTPDALVAVGPDSFRVTTKRDAAVAFVRDSTGRVVSLRLTQGERTVRATRRRATADAAGAGC